MYLVPEQPDAGSVCTYDISSQHNVLCIELFSSQEMELYLKYF